jgi:hypothetical protein
MQLKCLRLRVKALTWGVSFVTSSQQCSLACVFTGKKKDPQYDTSRGLLRSTTFFHIIS